jgi:hypothetical protein
MFAEWEAKRGGGAEVGNATHCCGRGAKGLGLGTAPSDLWELLRRKPAHRLQGDLRRDLVPPTKLPVGHLVAAAL